MAHLLGDVTPIRVNYAACDFFPPASTVGSLRGKLNPALRRHPRWSSLILDPCAGVGLKKWS